MKNAETVRHQKVVSDAFLILLNNAKQQLYVRNYFKNKIFPRGIIKLIQQVYHVINE